MKGGKAALLAAAAAAAAAAGTTDGSTTTTTDPTTTTDTTTSAPAPSPTPTPTPTTTTTTTTAALVIPSNYTIKQASAYGVKCDGVTDDTTALQSAFDKMGPYQALALPAGTCLTSWQVRVFNKADAIVFGAGASQTVIKASDPAHSAFVVSGSTRVVLNGFAVTSPNATTRQSAAPARGFYVEKSSAVTLANIAVQKVAAAGIVMWQTTDSKIENSLVADSLADGFHITGASRNILVTNNVAKGNGDDCFASIGYGTTLNQNISFVSNTCSDNAAAGVSFEGTTGGLAHLNQINRTGGPGIRIASKSSWNTGPVSGIDVVGNKLNGVRTRSDVDSTAIFVLTSQGNISDIRFSQNKVTNGNTARGRRLLNYQPGIASISNVSFDGEYDMDQYGIEKACLVTSDGVSGFAVTSSSLNEKPC